MVSDDRLTVVKRSEDGSRAVNFCSVSAKMLTPTLLGNWAGAGSVQKLISLSAWR